MMTLNAWALLGVAIVLEIFATSLLKASNGFARPWFGVGSIFLYSICFWAMAGVMTKIPVGVTYAIWSGVGIVGITLIGWTVFRQQLSPAQLACIGLIVIGAVGLNVLSRAAP
jgi:small multidrug resistance pump